MSNNITKWWAYEHINGHIQIKRYFEPRDLQEAKISPFCKRLFGPFEIPDEIKDKRGAVLNKVNNTLSQNVKDKTTYITFGFDHKHEVGGVTFDRDCVAAIPAETREEGRDKAFELFGREWCFEYYAKEFDINSMKHFPRGIISIPEPETKTEDKQ